MNLTDLDATDNAVLRDIITSRIREAGSISFSEFMRLALYHPVHGYYVTQDPALDYHSSPNTHPVFGAAIARQLADFWRLLDRPARFDVLEAGAGSGRLAADVLRALRASEPELYDATRYTLQDVTLGDGARERFERAGVPLDKVAVVQELPAEPTFEGAILSNELLDALPFDRVRVRDGRPYELHARLEGGRLVDVEVEPSAAITAHFAALRVLPGEGADAEVCLDAPAWIRRAAGALHRGYLLTLDYGYDAPELYAPWRKRGTLLTFYRHTFGDDPYSRIGRQDMTASVDFTSAVRAGEAAGLRTHGCTTQAEFLAALGVADALQRQPAPNEIEAYYALRRSVIELTDASGLGRIRVLIQGKGTPDATPLGLRGGLET